MEIIIPAIGAESSSSPLGSDVDAGESVTFSVNMTAPVIVTNGGNGSPTLSLNDGAFATYDGPLGTSTSTLTFSTIVQPGQNVTDLEATAFNLPSGSTIKDASGNEANLSGFAPIDSGVKADTTQPTLTNLVANGSTLTNASTVSYTVTFSETVTGVDAADFSLDASDTDTAASIASVTPVADSDGASYTVTVDTGGAGNNGTIDLDLTGQTIKDLAGNGYSGGNFQTQMTYATGVNPSSVAIGDLNNDGIPDLVVTNNGSNTVSVLLGNGNGTFRTQQTYATGIGPRFVAIGDVNGDGIPDLIVTNLNSNTVSVLLGNGNGTFKTQTSYATGSDPYSVVIHDVNGDGVPDLVVANENSATVSVLLGNGNGTFKTQTTYPTGDAPFSVSVVDVNNDGIPDLVVANDGGSSVSTLLGNGNGTFQPQATSSAGYDPIFVTTGDLNGDGIEDIVVANRTADTVSVLLGNGNGTFQSPVSYAAGSFPESVAIADLNGDGIPDLIVANINDKDVSVLLGNGDGTFQSQRTYAAGTVPNSVKVEDVNGDGRPDIVVSNYGSNNISVLLNEPQTVTGPTFTLDTTAPTVGTESSSSPGGTDVSANATVTFTVNMSEAVTVTVGANGAPTLSLNDGASATYVGPVGTSTSALTFSTTIAAGNNASDLQATAFNLPMGTTIQDAAGNNADLSGFSVIDTGVTVDTTPPSISAESSPSSAGADLGTGAVVTFAVDMSEPVVVTNGGNGSPTLSLNDGAFATYDGPLGTDTNVLMFSTTIQPGQNVSDLEATAFNLPAGATIEDAAGNEADLSGFTTLDTGAKVDTTPPTLTSLVADGSTFTGASTVSYTVTFSEAVTGVDAPDFSLDTSDTDTAASIASVTPVANSNGTSYTITVDTGGAGNNGTIELDLAGQTIKDLAGNVYSSGNLQPQQTYATGTNPRDVAIGDINGDGIPDLIVANGGDDTLSVMLGNGNGTFQAPTTYSTGDYPYSVAIADLNGDGKPDLVVANVGTDTVSVLLGNGDGTFQAQSTYLTGTNPYSVKVADVNGDGIPDIVTANGFDDDVSVLLGNGDGTFQPQQNYATGEFPASVAVADLNGDGIPDLAVPDVYSGTVSVFLGNGDGTFQPQQTYAVGTAPNSVAVGDLNGDGIPDLVVGDGGSEAVSVLLGNGNGTFQAQTTYAVAGEPNGIAIADLNGDGIPDLVVANGDSDTVSVLFGNGNGTFQAQQTYQVGNTPLSVTIADVNGDGRPDIIVANASDNDISILINNPQTANGPAFTLDTTSPTLTLSSATGDALQGGAAFTALGSASISDPDGPGTLTGATVTIANAQTGDLLGIDGAQNGTLDSGAISYAWSATDDTLTLSGSDSIADYEAALADVTYQDTGTDPSTGGHPSRTLDWSVSNALYTSSPDQTSITIDRAPAITNETIPVTAFTLTSTAGDNVLASGQVTDLDGDPLTVVAVDGVAGDVGSAVVATDGTLTLNGDGSFTYQETGDSTPTTSFTYTVSDGNGGTTTGTLIFSGAYLQPAGRAFASETISYTQDGAISEIDYAGFTGLPYTSKQVFYGSNGKPARATYSDGETSTWSYNPDGSYSITSLDTPGVDFTSQTDDYSASGVVTGAVLTGITGEPYTSETIGYTNGAVSEIDYAGFSKLAYTSEDITYGINGKPASAVYSDGETQTWTYNADGSYDIAYTDVPGATYASRTNDYNSNGTLTETSLVGISGSAYTTKTTFYTSSGATSAIDYAGFSDRAYTSEDVTYGSNGKQASAVYSDGETATWTYNNDGSYDITYADVAGAAYKTLENEYESSGKLALSVESMSNGTEIITGHKNGLTLTGVPGRDFGRRRLRRKFRVRRWLRQGGDHRLLRASRRIGP